MSKLIAIYLPQFHEINENNEWWGKGFTEWTNVKRGRPFYPGHYQPRVPYHSDYYDLSDLSVLEKHTRMAKDANIYGFAFYHYYFSGRKLLEKPIEQYRYNSKEDFPYCLIWANQSWSRTWYRADAGKTVLLEQNYGNKKEWVEHYNYLNKFFCDSRYIKIENKPVYIIYLPQDIPNRYEMFKLWNDLAIQNGFNGIYLIAMNTGYGVDRASNLYSAYMNFEPLCSLHADTSWRNIVQTYRQANIDSIKKKKCFLNYFLSKNVYSYNYLCSMIEKENIVNSSVKTFYGVFPGWDNTSRKDEDGLIIRNCSPKRFRIHIKKMLELSEIVQNEFLFLNAWNEWSEGAYIEPDERYGYLHLSIIKEELDNYG